VRAWFAAHPSPSPRDLVDAGYVVPHWPRPYGLDADPALQLIIEDEMRRAGASKPTNPIGIGHCGPILVALGSEEQKQRYLWPMLTGEELWCQLFSEPGAGSDLASLSTRAVRDGDVFVVNGQKIWTSLAQNALYGILIARTRTDGTKHTGISYFIVDMKAPGIEVHPIQSMTGPENFGFNQVFFTDVRVPAENLIGEENLGWGMAKTTLANERVSLSTGGGLQWGYGPSARELVAYYRDHPLDPARRQEVVDAYIEGEILRYHRMRMISAAVNKKPGPDASLRKALADPHGKRVFTLAKNLMGAHGMLTTNGVLGPEWDHGFLFSPALTIGGGTSEVLRNIIAERLLGLPHDPDVIPSPSR
jgi:alkylation response protein AidB-like acyl-CoA dehydrogenase